MIAYQKQNKTKEDNQETAVENEDNRTIVASIHQVLWWHATGKCKVQKSKKKTQ